MVLIRMWKTKIFITMGLIFHLDEVKEGNISLARRSALAGEESNPSTGRM